MSTCPICQSNYADKKNVHFIPWFMIKKNVTLNGGGLRDTELSFSIDSDLFTGVYQGRSVLPENVEALHESHNLRNDAFNHYSRDYLICSQCESKMSRLESLFATAFADPILQREFSSQANDSENFVLFMPERFHNSLFQLFVQSIFYRCSIARYNGFSLRPNVEKMISENLRSSVATTDFRNLRAEHQITLRHEFPIFASYLNIDDNFDLTSLFITINHSYSPYFLLAGKWIFELFEKVGQIKASSERLYGVSQAFNHLSLYQNVSSVPNLFLLNQEVSERIIKNVFDYFLERKMTGILKTIRVLHYRIFQRKGTEELYERVRQSYLTHFSNHEGELNSMINAFSDVFGGRN